VNAVNNALLTLVRMPSRNDEDALLSEEEVLITFVRSKNGKTRTIPVWFTLNSGKMELLPMYGLKTKWFVDLERSGRVGLGVKGWKKDAKPTFVRDPKTVDEIKERFSVKYGKGKVKKYYPTSEIALEIPL
jgi:hypothetical protein